MQVNNLQQTAKVCDTKVTLLEAQERRESPRGCRIITAEVDFGGVKARLSVMRAYNSFDDSGGTETLGRMGSGRGK
jgi:hypothetical protein